MALEALASRILDKVEDFFKNGWDGVSKAQRVFEINPIETKYISETIWDVTNIANATYDFYIPMDGYKHLSIQLNRSGGTDTATLTAEASNQNDGTAYSSMTYDDVTQYGFGSAIGAVAANYVDQAFMYMYPGMNARVIHVKVVIAGGTVDWDGTLHIKRWN